MTSLGSGTQDRRTQVQVGERCNDRTLNYHLPDTPGARVHAKREHVTAERKANKSLEEGEVILLHRCEL